MLNCNGVSITFLSLSFCAVQFSKTKKIVLSDALWGLSKWKFGT